MRYAAITTVLAAWLVSGTASATETNPNPLPPPPPPDIVDCADSANQDTCVECGSGGRFACCSGANCSVINKPKRTIRPRPIRPALPRLPSYPGAPGGGGAWDLF